MEQEIRSDGSVGIDGLMDGLGSYAVAHMGRRGSDDATEVDDVAVEQEADERLCIIWLILYIGKDNGTMAAQSVGISVEREEAKSEE